MKVLVTGVTGFVGGRLARALAQSGHDVRGLVRDASRWTDRPEGAEVCVGDITDERAVEQSVAGCDVVVHGAALVKAWAPDRRSFDRVNVGGLGNVVEAARTHGPRLLYVSSFVALGPTDGHTGDEAMPRAGTPFYNDYERTKWLADQLARHVSDQGLPLVRLYPGVVYGPGSLTDGNHVVKLLLDHARGKLPGYLGSGDLRQCFAYIDDVVAGIVAAVDRAQPGSGYILGGDNRTAIDLFQAFASASGVRPPRRHIPFGVAALIGKLQRWRAELLGIEPELTDEVVGIYRHEWAYSSALAERDLGYRVTPLAEGVRATVEWLRETGELS